MLLIILNTLLLMCKVYYIHNCIFMFWILNPMIFSELASQFILAIYIYQTLKNRTFVSEIVKLKLNFWLQYMATDYWRFKVKTYQTNAISKIKFLSSYSFKALLWNSLTSLRIWIWYLLRCLLSSAFSKFHLLGLRYQENIKYRYSLNLGALTTISFYFTAIFQRRVEHVWFHHSGRKHYWCHRHCWGWLLEAVPCG